MMFYLTKNAFVTEFLNMNKTLLLALRDNDQHCSNDERNKLVSYIPIFV
jgi:hypothetical protein